jgi:hypothetical protein
MNIQMNEPHGIGICDKKALNHKKKKSKLDKYLCITI